MQPSTSLIACIALIMTHVTLSVPVVAQRVAENAMKAESQSTSSRRSVTLALIQSMRQRDDIALVRRTSGPNSELVIHLLDASLTADLVAIAMRTASRLEREYAGAALVEIHIPKRAHLPAVPDRDAARIARILTDLRAAPAIDIPGVGHARAVTVPLEAP